MNRETREIILAVLTEWQQKAGYFQKTNLGNLVNQMAIRYANHPNLQAAVHWTLVSHKEPSQLPIGGKDRYQIIKQVGQRMAISENKPN